MPATKAKTNRLKEARKAAGLSQPALAERAGVSRITIARIEGGGYLPSVEIALAIAAVLDTTVENLFGGER